MCARLVRLQEAIVTFFEEQGVSLPLSDDDFVALKELCAVLAPLEEVSTVLQTDKHPSMHLVWPALHRLERFLTGQLTAEETKQGVWMDVKQLASPEVKMVVDSLVKNLQTKRSWVKPDTTNNPVPMAAAVLNPKTKCLPFLLNPTIDCANPTAKRDEKLDEVCKILLTDMGKLEDRKGYMLTRPGRAGDTDVQMEDPTEAWLNGPRANDTAVTVEQTDERVIQIEEETCEQELHHYTEMVLSNEQRAMPILQWWKTVGANRYPRLCQLAKKYLSVCATSAPSERVFSAMNITVNKKRARLASERREKLIIAKTSFSRWKKRKIVEPRQENEN
jgi:hypothetical protein